MIDMINMIKVINMMNDDWLLILTQKPEAVDSGTGARWHMGQEERWCLGVLLLKGVPIEKFISRSS